MMTPVPVVAKRGTAAWRGVGLALAATALLGAGGCRASDAARGGGATPVDRLMQFYPELRGGRFAVIADFEDARHMELIQLFGTTDVAKRAFDTRRGRKETGGRCLLFTAGSSNDAIVINNETASQWYLKRDWRAYDLLLISVQAPNDDVAVEISVSGGPPTERLTAFTTEALQRGWNLLRLDLAEIGERIPLDDVQEVRLSIKGQRQPVEIAIDDIVLTAYRRNLVGDPKDPAGGFFVQQAGRRWRIGAGKGGGQFELRFAHGQIVSWFNLAADPYRLKNLVRGAALGPTPMAVAQDGAVTSLAGRFGRNVIAHAKMVEANEVRAVVQAQWRFVREGREAPASLDDAPFARWTYAIYPTGQIFVTVETTSLPAGGAGRPGLAITLADTSEADFHIAALPGAPSSDPAGIIEANELSYATAHHEGGDASLLVAVSPSGGPVEFIRAVIAPAGDQAVAGPTSLVAVRAASRDAVETWQCHMYLHSGRLEQEEAGARARSALNPQPPRMEQGTPADNSETDAAGFAVGEGCFRITPDRGRVRLFLDGHEEPYFSPAFSILGPHNRVSWVYVDHLIYNAVTTDHRGQLLFQLPGTIRKSRLVEVYFRRDETP